MKLQDLVEELHRLLGEAGKEAPAAASSGGNTSHDPYVNTNVIKPGVMQGPTKRKRGDWDCSCHNYVCNCTGKGGKTKKVKTSPAKKRFANRRRMDFMQGKISARGKKRRAKGQKG